MTARLILINGIPASGKTTLARAWCERHATLLPLALDIDTIRSMIGGWRHALREAGMAARDVAIAGAAAHLTTGHDVMIPQYLQRGDFIDRLEHTAHTTGATFVEIALTIDASTAERRFTARAALAEGVDPHGQLHTDMAAISKHFDDFLQSRPHAVRIESGGAAMENLESVLGSSSLS